jgi:hypothetical protein
LSVFFKPAYKGLDQFLPFIYDNCFRVVFREPLGPRSSIKSTEVIHRKDDMNSGTSSVSHVRKASPNNCLGEVTRPV